MNHPTHRRLKRITDNFFAKIGWPVLIAPLFMSQWGAHCYLDVNVNEHDFSNVIEIHKKQEIPLWFCVCEINLSSLRVVFSVWTEGDAKGPRRASCWCLFVIPPTTKGHKQKRLSRFGGVQLSLNPIHFSTPFYHPLDFLLQTSDVEHIQEKSLSPNRDDASVKRQGVECEAIHRTHWSSFTKRLQAWILLEAISTDITRWFEA